MEERDVCIVQRYIKNCSFEPEKITDEESLEIASYSNWAACMILNRAIDELFKPPPYVGGDPAVDLIDVVEEFAFDMRRYSEMNESNSRMFEIAESVADDILYFYIQERREKK